MIGARSRNQARARVRGGRAWVRMGLVVGPKSMAWMTPADVAEAAAASVILGEPSPALSVNPKEAA